MEGTPLEDAPPPPPQRATPARKGGRNGAGAGSPRPHRPHPGHTGLGTPTARPRGRAAGRGTAPDTRRPSQRWQATPPRGRPPTTRAVRRPHRACRPRGQCRAPTPAHPRPRHVVDGPRQPARRAGSRERGSAWPQTPVTTVKAPPRGRPSAIPTVRHASSQGRALWGRCRVPTPAPTAPGAYGSRNPGCPHQRAGNRRRDSAQGHQTPITTVAGPQGTAAPHHPRGTQPRKGVQAKGTVLGPHTRTTACNRPRKSWLINP